MQLIKGSTSIVGLIGQPVKHSLSPVMHNAAFEHLALNWCYLAFPCQPDDLKQVLESLYKLNCQGLNITIPYKQNVAKYCTELSPLASQLGAVNTLIPNKDGGWTGDNTDLIGFIQPLKEKKWVGNEAVLLGYGGSALAVMAGLNSFNLSKITIIGRNTDKLHDFLSRMTIKSSNLISENTKIHGIIENDQNKLVDSIKNADLVINATPVGMHSGLNSQSKATADIPLGINIWENLKPNAILYDLIYTPRPTPWLRFGQEKGHETIDGLEMLVQQGAASLRLWSNHAHIPVDLMRSAAESFLTN